MSTHRFSMDPERIDDKFIHLTNSSIQKQVRVTSLCSP